MTMTVETTEKDERFAGSKVRHGTNSGWTMHQRVGTEPCDPCYRAKEEYDDRRREVPENAIRNRAAARAQGRAHSRMKDLYPEVYRVLYEEEKAIAYREAGIEE